MFSHHKGIKRSLEVTAPQLEEKHCIHKHNWISFYLKFLIGSLTYTRDIVTVVKPFHSSVGNESIMTNAGIIWSRVKTFGISSTQVHDFWTLINILKQKIRTSCSHKQRKKKYHQYLWITDMTYEITYRYILQIPQRKNFHSELMIYNHQHTCRRSCQWCCNRLCSLHRAQSNQDNPHPEVHIH